MNSENTTRKYNTVINVLYYGIIGLAVYFGVRLAFKYLLPAAYPFLIAYPVALLLNPLMRFLEKKLGLPKKVGGFLLVTMSVAGVFFLLYLLINRAAEEVGRLADALSHLEWEDLRPLREKANDLLLKLPWMDEGADLERFWQAAEERAGTLLSDSVPGLRSTFGMLTGIFTGLLDFFLAFFVTVVACYYMTVDRAAIAAFAYRLFPKSMENSIKSFRKEVFGTVGKYLKAYGIIILITFTELFAAFTVLRIEYALLLAAVVALIDILPVLGTGSVLVPWALVCLFVVGDVYTGAGLLISYVIITVIRQIIEPKIVGSYIGLHPLATLVAMFAGLKVFGIMGMLLLPMVVLVAKNLMAAKKAR